MKVLRPGLLTTVQDLGRAGYRRYGVAVGGAMDPFAIRLANRLVGNRDTAAALEITLTGPTLEFEEDALIAICGADLSPAIEDRPVPQWRPACVQRGAVLKFGQLVSGCRAYLAIAGGIEVPKVLGGRGTHLRARFGGLEGHALRAGDELEPGRPPEIILALMRKLRTTDGQLSAAEWRVSQTALPTYRPEVTARIVAGDCFDLLTAASRELLLSTPFAVTADSDRMGYRLKGSRLDLSTSLEAISEPVCAGTMQLPPEGHPVLLMVDCQTTGGYPRIAHVISVDLSLLGQLKPGDHVRFSAVSLDEAQQLHLAHQQRWEQLAQGIAWRIAST
jgi:antagonist of KipI